MNYRPEIDGLRAIAVSLVLIFHFFPTFVPNGFIGVDLFFTISGYVITRQIYRQIQDGEFSFQAFFARRVRRIMPLVFTVVTATMIAGYFILLPNDFTQLTESVVAVSTLWSNIFFWRDGGYFGSQDKLKPLLHMWSLSVEEQFYILFPSFLLLLTKFRHGGGERGRWAALLGVGMMTCVSLFVYVGLHAIGGSSPAFFLTPSRMWQFGLGAIVAIWIADQKSSGSPQLSMIALAAVVFPGIFSLPSYAANFIVPISGALYIAIASRTNAIDKVMSSSLMRYLGTRSFSLYVWHWPIVAYVNYVFVNGIPAGFMILGLLLSVALSELSFRWIEEPFRRTYTTRASFMLICVALVVGSGLVVLHSLRAAEGLKGALASQIQTNFRCKISDFAPYGASRACFLGEPELPRDVALLGNSHAQMYAEVVVARADNNASSVVLVPLNGCLPTPTLNLTSHCMTQAATNLRAILDDIAIRTVIIGSTFPDRGLVDENGYVPDETLDGRLEEAFIELVDTLLARGRRVILIGPIAYPGFNLPSELARGLHFGDISVDEAVARLSVSRSTFYARFSPLIQEFTERLGPDFLRPDLVLCDKDFCHFGDEYGSFFADSNHLGIYGVSTIGSIFEGF